MWVQRSRFSAPIQWVTFQTCDVDHNQESAFSENMQFLQIYWISNKASGLYRSEIFKASVQRSQFSIRKQWATFRIYYVQFGSESQILQPLWKQAMSHWAQWRQPWWFRFDNSKALVHYGNFMIWLCHTDQNFVGTGPNTAISDGLCPFCRGGSSELLLKWDIGAE